MNIIVVICCSWAEGGLRREPERVVALFNFRNKGGVVSVFIGEEAAECEKCTYNTYSYSLFRSCNF